MPHLSSQSQALLTSFGQQQGVTADQVRNLEGVINSSPALIDQVNAAVASGYLTKFQLLPAGTHAGGTYDGQNKAINQPASALASVMNDKARSHDPEVLPIGQFIRI